MVRTILGHFDLDIDFLPHFYVYHVRSISPILQLTFLKCVLCLTNSFGGILHVTVTFLVSIWEGSELIRASQENCMKLAISVV